MGISRLLKLSVQTFLQTSFPAELFSFSESALPILYTYTYVSYMLNNSSKFYLGFGIVLDFRLDALLFSSTSSRELQHATCRNDQ